MIFFTSKLESHPLYVLYFECNRPSTQLISLNQLLLLHVYYRSNTTTEELGEMTKTTNPDEINIDEDYSTDEEEEVEGKTG